MKTKEKKLVAVKVTLSNGKTKKYKVNAPVDVKINAGFVRISQEETLIAIFQKTAVNSVEYVRK